MAEVASVTLPDLSGLAGDHVRKSSKHGKKRHRDSNHTDKAERKHKRSKSEAASDPSQAAEVAEDEPATKEKRKSHKSSKAKDGATENGDDGSSRKAEKKKHRKGEGVKDEKKSKKKKSKDRVPEADVDVEAANDDDDDDPFDTTLHPNVVVLSSSRSKKHSSRSSSSKHQFPFYTQTVSQYLPLHPLGINEPIQGYINQHLEPLLNRYVPTLGGVLLAYRNSRIGEAPGSGSLTEQSGTEEVAVFESINEYAVSFGWLTVEIDIFRPARGAWMEGLVNIQSGGHVGIVCWGKFNASIESGRLPRDWEWVDNHSSEAAQQDAAPEISQEEEDTEMENADADADADQPEATTAAAEPEPIEVHATGYWIDGRGAKVTGDTPIGFRIKNYEVGSSGEYGYLSIEGTMLSEEDEAKAAQKESAVLNGKSKHASTLRREKRQLMKLGITKFGDGDDDKDKASQGERADGQRSRD
ncbi:hypothetical protein F4808DRAFT_365759 [Astrocystis sublimbata]|nr:hypothetical protein F4808DRAFT_365759 [Astrocystis sublimbata]